VSYGLVIGFDILAF